MIILDAMITYDRSIGTREAFVQLRKRQGMYLFFFFHPPADGEKLSFSSPHFHVFSYASCVDLTQLLSQPNASWRTLMYHFWARGLDPRIWPAGRLHDKGLRHLKFEQGESAGRSAVLPASQQKTSRGSLWLVPRLTRISGVHDQTRPAR